MTMIQSERVLQEGIQKAQVVLRMEGLTKRFGGQTVLDGVCAQLRAGEVVLLRGENGSGKTTLLNMLSGALEPDAGELELRTNGKHDTFRFPRPPWHSRGPLDHFTPDRVARGGTGRTWQEIRLFGTRTMAENLTVAPPDQPGEDPLQVLARWPLVRRLQRQGECHAAMRLQALGLGARAQSFADQVSLGQAKRVAIARAVEAGAKVLLLDEPLAGLDAAGVDQVLGMLRGLVADRQVTLVIVEHVFNIPTVLPLATKVWTLDRGRLNEENPRDLQQLDFDEQSSWLARRLQEWVGGGSARSRALIGGARLLTASLRSEAAEPAALTVSRLLVRRGRRLLFSADGSDLGGLDLELRSGQIAVLQAPNGWGKTSLLEAVAGLLPITSGTVSLNGSAATRWAPWRRAQQGMTLVRSRDNTFPGLSVSECFRLVGDGVVPESLSHLDRRSVSDLSGGEKHRLALAMALGQSEPDVILLDEPFSALDAGATDTWWQRIAALAKRAAVLIAVPSGVWRDSIS